MTRKAQALVGLLALTLGVAGVPGMASGQGTQDDSLVPAGFGTLRQDQVTLQLRSGDLLVKVTPLREWVIRLTAPDTYDRLSALKMGHGQALRQKVLVDEPLLVLVQLFSNEPNVTYQPEDIILVNQGLKYRPLEIQPITPGWGNQRLDQQETQLALYAFAPEIDLEVDLAVEYRNASAGGWERLVPLLEAEQGKVRARAGSGGSGD